jgi:hypothetical protein
MDLLGRSGMAAGSNDSKEGMAIVPDPIGMSIYAFDGIQAYFATYFSKSFMPTGLVNIGTSAIGLETVPVVKDISGVQVIWAAYILGGNPSLGETEIKMISCRPTTTFHSIYNANVRLQFVTNSSNGYRLDSIRFISDKAWLPKGPVSAPAPYADGYALGELFFSDFVLAGDRYIPRQCSFIENALVLNKRGAAAQLVRTHRASFSVEKVDCTTTNVSASDFVPALNGIMTTEDRRFARDSVPIISYISSNGVWLDKDAPALRRQVEASKRAAASPISGEVQLSSAKLVGPKTAVIRVVLFGSVVTGVFLLLHSVRQQRTKRNK